MHQFTVKFDTGFTPGTFRADLDGQDWTGLFSPAAVPGGTSSAPAPDAFVGGKQIIGPGPVPGSTVTIAFAHTLNVSGNASDGRLCCYGNSVEFIPPMPSTDPQFLELSEGAPVRASVAIPLAPSHPVVVTVTPSNIGVSLDGGGGFQPAGAPIQVTIPTNDRRAFFAIRGISRGPFSLFLHCTGCEDGGNNGHVH